ncbi:hypothetical protein ASPZODRAFT_19234 [Penicilliopsis zonata CBS 506.65]|uniref:Uncharacterized protein n=1 Tax=Penicilliopsis zonata CBS 506.65 TaxID=1073090 RepID=A0A1L9S8M5_9EURO|nr:hypothetical protein ASPZODRAFT_19234 [Penicilliopsis zonata CBS 506.65]OJJ43511.1 hypothetical protein ASPZODRAFT_19234 [Penicilliopsis zonata CBS 506.65]
MSQPPSYTADNSPPSYEALVKRFEDAVGSNPTPEKYLSVADTFTTEEITILADGSEIVPPPVDSDEEKAKFKASAASTRETEIFKAVMKAASEGATVAAFRLRSMLQEIHLKIIELDRIERSGFEPEMRGFVLEYDAILRIISIAAAEIKADGGRFDVMLIPVCLNPDVSNTTKRTLLLRFIADAENHEQTSQEAQDRLRTLKTNLISFVTRFDDWGKEREGELEQQIQDLQEEINQLRDEILKATKDIETLQAIQKIFASMSLFALIFSGPVAAIIAIGGMIGVAGTAIAIAAKNKLIEHLNHNILGKEGDIDRAREKIVIIQNTRAGLTMLRDTNLTSISEDVNLLDSFWNRAKQDAYSLLRYVDGDTESEYVEDYLEFGLETYKDLAEYIGDFGRSITNTMTEIGI